MYVGFLRGENQDERSDVLPPGRDKAGPYAHWTLLCSSWFSPRKKRSHIPSGRII